ncbi:STM4015 family protein [Actinoplanes sp. NPDC020271]|uniref:STM4015 family protein n=1 Tax=Actinoplanes sp. NPDC020271 TaxID=3363896 RepID=UPI0037974DB6
MTFHQHDETFAGLPVTEFPAESVAGPVAWRVSYDEEDTSEEAVSPGFRAKFETFLSAHGATTESLVIGPWGYAAFDHAPLTQLQEAAPRLPGLRSLFLGDITFDECEISWMKVGDVSPLITSFPLLETLQVRGGEQFGFAPVASDSLRRLVVQSGGLPRSFTAAVLGSTFPQLTELELWLGTPDYGGDTTVADLSPLLGGTLFPGLRRLGLRNAEIADELAAAIAHAPIVARLESLDLSMGVLSDRGAHALLAGQPLTHLRELHLAHHYLSEETAAAVVAALPGTRVDVSEPQGADEDDRYVAVAE